MTYAVATTTRRALPDDGSRQDPGSATFSQPVSPRVCGYIGSSVLYPLSYPYHDLEGRVVQLWKWKERLIASILLSDGSIHIAPGAKIHNALLPKETDVALLHRIERVGMRLWQISVMEEQHDLYVWPWLEAAGKDDVARAKNALGNIKDHLAKTD